MVIVSAVSESGTGGPFAAEIVQPQVGRSLLVVDPGGRPGQGWTGFASRRRGHGQYITARRNDDRGCPGGRVVAARVRRRGTRADRRSTEPGGRVRRRGQRVQRAAERAVVRVVQRNAL